MSATTTATALSDSQGDQAGQFDALKRRYDRDGFLILRSWASPAEVAQLRANAEPVARRILDARPKGGDFKDTVKQLEHGNPWFVEQLAGGRHVPLLRTLIGDEIEPVTAAWFDRPIGSRERVGPHIDGGGRGRGNVGATFWIALDAAGTDNGCLHYRRGSHRKEYTKRFFIDDFDTETDAVAAEVAPGDAVVHSSLTVHWSGVNLSHRPRRAVSFFYWGAKSHAAWLKTPDAAWVKSLEQKMQRERKAQAAQHKQRPGPAPPA